MNEKRWGKNLKTLILMTAIKVAIDLQKQEK